MCQHTLGGSLRGLRGLRGTVRGSLRHPRNVPGTGMARGRRRRFQVLVRRARTYCGQSLDRTGAPDRSPAIPLAIALLTTARNLLLPRLAPC
jgi:hypothetical protein